MSKIVKTVMIITVPSAMIYLMTGSLHSAVSFAAFLVIAASVIFVGIAIVAIFACVVVEIAIMLYQRCHDTPEYSGWF